ncbi:MAG: ATP-dependent zinc metalloprotease FtsH [Planctomycetota bacterium]|jgi:cell division protease FtsH
MSKRDDKDRFGIPQRPEDPTDPEGAPRPRLGRQLLVWAVLIGALLVALFAYKRISQPVEKLIDLRQFERMMAAGQVAQLRIEGIKARGMLKPSAGGPKAFRVVLLEGYRDEHLDEWLKQVPEGGLTVKEPGGMVPMILLQMAPLLLLLVLMVYFFNRQMRAASSRDGWMPFVGGGTAHARKEKPAVTFDDVAGVEEAKEEVQEIVQFLGDPEKFQRIGGRIPRGVLLVGAPGTGKTLLAKAIAGEADVPFFSLCGSDFVELFVGVGAARVRDLFRKARQSQPAIIFLDEIDAVGRKRGTGLGGGHDEREQTLNAILSEMDGFTRDEGVIVMAATNRPDVLDPALLRPGRFDREIIVDMPDVRGREEILKVHTRKVRTAPEVSLNDIARGSPGFTGADLEALVNEAAIQAAIEGREEVTMAELEEARDKVRFGRQKKRSRVMSDEDRRMTAYHEAGHAMVAKLDESVEPLHKVTIIPRGVALGMTMVLPEKDKYGMRMKECLGVLKMNMAGRVAEEMFCGDISSGAENDIKAATNLARRMVTQWGMSEQLGPISYSDEEQHVFLGNEITKGKRHSEEMAQQIDREVRAIVMDSYGKARELCEEHSAELQRVAEALLELETLTGDDVDGIFEGATVADLAARRQEEAEPAAPTAEQTVGEEKPDEDAATGGYPHPAGSPA